MHDFSLENSDDITGVLDFACEWWGQEQNWGGRGGGMTVILRENPCFEVI